jgi:hypothetical protein
VQAPVNSVNITVSLFEGSLPLRQRRRRRRRLEGLEYGHGSVYVFAVAGVRCSRRWCARLGMLRLRVYACARGPTRGPALAHAST